MSNVIQSANDLPVVFFKFSVHGRADKRNVREMSETIESEANAGKGVATVLLRRIPVCYAAPIKQVEGKIRNHFYKKAIQLGDSFGVPIAVLPAFRLELDKLIQEYNLHMSNLIAASENGDLLKKAQEQLADLQDKVDIPTTDEIKSGYGVTVSTNVNYQSQAVQEALKLLTDEIKAQLKQEVEASTKKDNEDRIASVTGQVVETVKEFLTDVKTRCGKDDPKGVQFKTLVDKMVHIVNTLPHYNVTNDPALINLIDAVKTKFGTLNKDILKADPSARQQTVAAANELTQAFGNMFN